MGSDQVVALPKGIINEVSIPQSGFYGFRRRNNRNVYVSSEKFQSLSRDSMGSDALFDGAYGVDAGVSIPQSGFYGFRPGGIKAGES